MYICDFFIACKEHLFRFPRLSSCGVVFEAIFVHDYHVGGGSLHPSPPPELCCYFVQIILLFYFYVLFFLLFLYAIFLLSGLSNILTINFDSIHCSHSVKVIDISGLFRLFTRLKIYNFIIFNDARNRLLRQDTNNNTLLYSSISTM